MLGALEFAAVSTYLRGMAKHNFRSLSSRFRSVFTSVVAPCLGLAVTVFSSQAEAQIRMISPNGLAYVETQSVAQSGGFTAMGSYADGFDENGDGVTDDYRGGVYLYEWG